MEVLVDACGFAGGVEVHQEAADDVEHDGRQLGSAETAGARLEGCEPVKDTQTLAFAPRERPRAAIKPNAAVSGLTRGGRGTRTPEQFGHRFAISPAHESQNVHS